MNFALFDLVRRLLSPRIHDLGKIVPYRMGSQRNYTGTYPTTGPLLTGLINQELIVAQWNAMLRLADSFTFGHATASLPCG